MAVFPKRGLRGATGSLFWPANTVWSRPTWDFREVWTKVATQVEFVSIPQCEHLPHEEKPQEVTQALLKFLEPWRLSTR